MEQQIFSQIQKCKNMPSEEPIVNGYLICLQSEQCIRIHWGLYGGGGGDVGAVGHGGLSCRAFCRLGIHFTLRNANTSAGCNRSIEVPLLY